MYTHVFIELFTLESTLVLRRKLKIKISKINLIMNGTSS